MQFPKLFILFHSLYLCSAFPSPMNPIPASVPAWEILAFGSNNEGKMTIDEFGVHFRKILVDMAAADQLPVSHLSPLKKEAFFDKATAGAMQELKRMRKEKAVAAELAAAKEYIKTLSLQNAQHAHPETMGASSAAEALPIPRSSSSLADAPLPNSQHPISSIAESKQHQEFQQKSPRESLPRSPPQQVPVSPAHKAQPIAVPSAELNIEINRGGSSSSSLSSTPPTSPASAAAASPPKQAPPKHPNPNTTPSSPKKEETSFWDWLFPDSSHIPRRLYPAGRI